MTTAPTDTAVSLSPAQATSFDRLLDTVRGALITILVGPAGCGKTTLVSRLGAVIGRAARVSPSDIIEAAPLHGHAAVDETIHRLIAD